MPIAEPRLEHVRVHDAMHTGILTTDENTPLRVVAGLMAEQRVHAVAVTDPDNTRRPWGIVSALDIVAAAAVDADETAGEAAETEVVVVSSGESLYRAAQLMIEHGVDHLVVVDAASGHPAGIISALDIAYVYAG